MTVSPTATPQDWYTVLGVESTATAKVRVCAHTPLCVCAHSTAIGPGGASVSNSAALKPPRRCEQAISAGRDDHCATK